MLSILDIQYEIHSLNLPISNTFFLPFPLPCLYDRAFARYDVDGDGFISVKDLKEAFERQQRTCTEAELLSWVRKRDTSGSGAVGFEDFVRHYQ